MTVNEVAFSTPRYVLLDEQTPLGPSVMSSGGAAACSVIFGFSDKEHYDRFCQHSDRALRPYPLVERYVRNRVGEPGSELRLIVLDAEGPREHHLHAATMESVLEAQAEGIAHVTTAYLLTLDPSANAYRLESARPLD